MMTSTRTGDPLTLQMNKENIRQNPNISTSLIKSNDRISKDVPTLICERLQGALKLDFGVISANTINTLRFRLINPNSSKSISIEIEKKSISKGLELCFDQKLTSTTIPSNSSIIGTVSWLPEIEMSIREVIELKMDEKITLRLQIQGETEQSQTVTVVQKKTGKVLPHRSFGFQRTNVESKRGLSHQTQHVSISQDWLDVQLAGFSRWMNFVFEEGTGLQSVPLELNGEECEVCQGSELADVRLARRRSQLRDRARRLVHSETFENCRTSLKEIVESGRIKLREDCDPQTDIFLQTSLLEILLSYQRDWLGLAMETLFRTDPIKDSQFKKEVKKFILSRLLAPESGTSQGSRRTPQSGKPLLIGFLELVVFLDYSRLEELIPIPVLFCPQSSEKSSRQVINTFSQKFLKSSPDLGRLLASIGCGVGFVQKPQDEVQLRVLSLPEDIKDGALLVKLIDVLKRLKSGGMGSEELGANLRLPAITILQKTHNVKLALQALGGMLKNKDSLCKGVIEGDKGAAVALIWAIFLRFEIRAILSSSAIEGEVQAIRQNASWRKSVYGEEAQRSIQSTMAMTYRREMMTNPALDQEQFEISEEEIREYLLKWVDSVSGQYGLPVEALSDLEDGRALCLLVHYYHPSLFSLEAVQAPSTVQGVRANVSLFRTSCKSIGGIPSLLVGEGWGERDLMLLLSYLFVRLTSIASESRAAVRIQRFFRKYGKISSSIVLKLLEDGPIARSAAQTVADFRALRRVQGSHGVPVEVFYMQPKVLPLRVPLSIPLPAPVPVLQIEDIREIETKEDLALIKVKPSSPPPPPESTRIEEPSPVKLEESSGVDLDFLLNEESSDSTRHVPPTPITPEPEDTPLPPDSKLIQNPSSPDSSLLIKIKELEEEIGRNNERVQHELVEEKLRAEELLRVERENLSRLREEAALRESRVRLEAEEQSRRERAEKEKLLEKLMDLEAQNSLYQRQQQQLIQHNLARNQAAVVLQKLWRGSRQFAAYGILRLTTLRTQAWVRRGLQMKRFLRVRLAVLCIQATWRKFLLVRGARCQSEVSGLKIKAFLLQRRRAKLSRENIRREAALMRSDRLKLTKGFQRLAAVWRSRAVLRSSSKEVLAMRARLRALDCEDRRNPHKLLCHRTVKALKVILEKRKSPDWGLKAWQFLERSTLWSRQCCEIFLLAKLDEKEESFSSNQIVFGMMKSCKRTEPSHHQFLRHVLQVYHHVSRFPELAQEINQVAEASDILLDLLQIFRDVPELFGLLVDLFQRLTDLNESFKERSKHEELVKRLVGIQQIFERKVRMDARLKSLEVSTSVASAQNGQDPQSQLNRVKALVAHFQFL